MLDWTSSSSAGHGSCQAKAEAASSLPAVASYERLPGLEHLYLEDSWVLGVYESDVSLSFDLDAVLTEQHPQWHPPRPGEQYAYRRMALTFPSVRSVEWLSRGGPPATDASGKRDWGNIDSFVARDDGTYELEGDWGHVRVASDAPEVRER